MHVIHASGSPQVHANESDDGPFQSARPRVGNAVPPVAVTADRNLCRVEQRCLALRRSPPREVTTAEPLPAATGVFASKPADRPSPSEGGEIAERRFGHAMPEVIGPS